MRSTLSLIIALAATGMFGAVTASAQEKGTVKLKCVAQKEVEVVKDDGTRVMERQPVKLVLPKDTVIYTITYQNVGKENADNVVVNNPVPDNTVYIDGSAKGEGTRIDFSVDGGKTFAAPEKLILKDKDGNERIASAAEYTHIRWVVQQPVKPGAEGTVEFKVVLK